ncbi:DUF2157 domain-containing protein [Acinetobacter sp. WCHAc010052]|uniref:DUF2157 domain-containing protein n=1 Tax=Acinetobacter sp. WCHAc010052 TaxID=2004647 RepID=UPI000B3C421C|nr:DUF2157 domain-containing protein [Acinetobacter sp. WCHAc010052]AXY59438.1 DUF2157 domain-containing protein [Acinetobacter sp. WCHAc010052]
MIRTQQTVFSWQDQKFVQHLQIFGFTLIAVSVLYLIAANWFMLPQSVQLVIPQLLLLLSALSSVFLVKNDSLIQCLHAVCGLMIGLCMAVIGQVYQTGADSYLLFFIWSVLLLPWLYRSSIGIFFLLCIVSQIALFLFFIQTFWGDESPTVFLLSIHLLALLQFLFCLRYYPKIRYLFIIWFAMLSVWNMVMFLYMDKGLLYFICSLILLSIAFIYFYKKNDQLCSVLSAVTLGITFTLIIVKWLDNLFRQSEILGLLIIAVIIFAWFALITFLLIKFIPNSRFNNIPLAVGAWISGIVLSSLMLTFWGNFSLIMGIIFVAFAAYMLKIKQNLFLRQLAYCLFVAGQVAILFHTYDLTEKIYPLLLIQAVGLIVAYWVRTHWFFVFVQLSALYALGVAMIWHDNAAHFWMGNVENFAYLTLLTYVFYTALLWVQKIQPQQYQRSLMLCNLVITVFSVGFYAFLGKSEFADIQLIPAFTFGLPILWCVLFLILHIQNQFNFLAQCVLAIFGAVLIYFGYFEIFIVLAVLSWALMKHDKFISAFALLTLTVILWCLYYSLEVTFLVKSLSIFISGITLLLLSLCLVHFKNKEGITQ